MKEKEHLGLRLEVPWSPFPHNALDQGNYPHPNCLHLIAFTHIVHRREGSRLLQSALIKLLKDFKQLCILLTIC